MTGLQVIVDLNRSQSPLLSLAVLSSGTRLLPIFLPYLSRTRSTVATMTQSYIRRSSESAVNENIRFAYLLTNFLTLPYLLRALLQRLEYFWGTDEYFVCCDLQRCCRLCIIITVFYLILTVITQSCHLRNASAELESGVYNTVKLKYTHEVLYNVS